MKLDIHVHIYNERSEQLDKVLVSINSIRNLIMTSNADFQAGFAKVDAATNALAARIEALTASLKSGLNPAEEAAALAQLEALVPVLEGLAKDASDPVPVELPPEEPPVTP